MLVPVLATWETCFSSPPCLDVVDRRDLEVGAPSYRFVRRYLERKPHVPVTLRQIDPIIRQLTLYRDLIDQKTGDQK